MQCESEKTALWHPALICNVQKSNTTLQKNSLLDPRATGSKNFPEKNLDSESPFDSESIHI